MKDAYYFPHFCNARHDRKIMRLRKELGVEGYGIFFMLLEILREQIDFKFPMRDIDLLADEFGCSEQKIRVAICNYQLFELDPEEQFFSPKLLVYLEPYLNMKEQRRLAGIKSGEVRRLKAGTTVEQPLNENEQSKEKEKKVKEIKVNKIKEYTSNEVLIKALENFIDMRKKNGGITDNAISLMLDKLNKMANNDNDKIEILNQSTMNSWKGIFEIKEDFKSKPQQQVKQGQNNVSSKRQHDVDELEKMLLGR